MPLEIEPLVKGTLDVVRDRVESQLDTRATLRVIGDFVDLSHLSQLSTTFLMIKVLGQRVRFRTLTENDVLRLAQSLRHQASYVHLHHQVIEAWASDRMAFYLTNRMDDVGRSLEDEEEAQAMGIFNYCLDTIHRYSPRFRIAQRTLAMLEFLDINDSLVGLRTSLRGEASELRKQLKQQLGE